MTHRALFESSPAAEALVVEEGDNYLALFFHTYTFEGRHGLHLEDLFVRGRAVVLGLLAQTSSSFGGRTRLCSF